MIATDTSRETSVRGRLELIVGPRPTGATLTHAYVRAPLKIVRPFLLDDGRVLVQILALGPGLCGGDEHTIDITVEAGARAVVIMQSASRVVSMSAEACATQNVTLNVEPGGHLEYYPGLTIPYRDSSFVQRVTVNAARESRVGILETWGTGRVARGEHLAFRRISSRTTVLLEGDIVYADATELDPRKDDVGGTGVLEGHRYFASGFWHNAALDSSAALAAREGVLAAFGQSTDASVYLRALAVEGSAILATTHEAVQMVNATWGLPPIPMRRFTS